ncbi:MAG: hypothetical protein K5978_04560 [Campylobacter sp.]|nr:hypothetical protein [Campylobacter sp.]
MLYVETSVAAEIFYTSSDTLKKSAQRNSAKYPFIRITDAKTRSRGGVKLLFEVDIADLKAYTKSNGDISVYMFKDNEYKQMKFSDIAPKNSKEANTSKDISYFSLDDSEQEAIDKKLKILKEWDECKKIGLSYKKFCSDFNISEEKLFRW